MAIPPAVVGAGIAAAGSMFGNFASNIGSRKAMNRQYAQSKEFWGMQNQYNHPSAQMQRLREAGLNPNLIYGTSPSSAVGQADKGTVPEQAKVKFDNPLQNINQFQDTKVKQAQTNLLQAQENTQIQQQALIGAQTSKVGAETGKTQFDLNLAKDLRNTSLQAAEENLRFSKQKTIGIKVDNFIKDQTKATVVKQIAMDWKIATQTLQGKKLDNVYKQFEADLARLRIRRSDPFYYKMFTELFHRIKSMSNSFQPPIKQ